MKRFRVDLHIHSLLSPCGDLGMSPATIVGQAVAAGLDAIAVCDHNTTLQTPVIAALGRERGLQVFQGVELTSREEVHCVALLPDGIQAAKLQQWIDRYLVRIPHNPGKLGDQVWVDRNERIVGEVEWYLNAPIDRSIEEVAGEVVRLGGLFVPAHIDRPSNSLIGQLGFLPSQLPVAAVEYNRSERFARLVALNPDLAKYTAYTVSDAHFPELIGTNPSWLYADDCSFGELRMAFAGACGRYLVSCGMRI